MSNVRHQMTELSSHHRIEYESIRALAIECHALDLSAHTLFIDGTHSPSKSTRMTYEELLANKLLMLAIGLRTKFYQGVPHEDTRKYVVDCGFLDEDKKGERVPSSLTIKDVCDKLIHATQIERTFSDKETGLMTTIHGRQGKTSWKLVISMSLFAEAVLNWIDERPDA